MPDSSETGCEIIATTSGKLHVWRMEAFEYACKVQGKRNVEKEAVKQLLVGLGFGEEPLNYLPSGQPVFAASKEHLSISHSDGWFAVYIAHEKVGVDIQVRSPRIAQGKNYFLNENERHLEDTDLLHLIWGAKEALYKKYGGEMHDLREEVTFESLDDSSQSLYLIYKGDIERFSYRIETEYFLVWS